jgi:hypothetical protein
VFGGSLRHASRPSNQLSLSMPPECGKAITSMNRNMISAVAATAWAFNNRGMYPHPRWDGLRGIDSFFILRPYCD